MTTPIRVLVVDDSAFARKVLRQVLSASPDIEVVGHARDGLEALEKIEALRPDVITLDLVMPNLDGLGVLRHLRGLGDARGPEVVLVSFSHQESDLVVEGLELGAVAMVRKPTAQATDRLFALSDEVVAAVRTAAGVKGAPRPTPSVAPVSPRPAPRDGPLTARRAEVVVVGTSTGGPQALSRLLADLPALPVPLLIALHIPGEYTEALARRLDQRSKLSVVEAQSGLVLEPGMAVVAKGGIHLRVERRGSQVIAELDARPADALYHPSVDVLLSSAVEVYGGRTLAVVLTGMGDDGKRGASQVIAAGGRVLTEAESSCVVYGMPRAVKEAGWSSGEARIEDMAAEIVRGL